VEGVHHCKTSSVTSIHATSSTASSHTRDDPLRNVLRDAVLGQPSDFSVDFGGCGKASQKVVVVVREIAALVAAVDWLG
jgi:hypothetical protein